MRQLAITLFFLTASITLATAQYIPVSSQAFQFASAYNPAFTGIEEFTDIKFGYRYQMVGFGVNSPKFVNLSANFRLKNPVDMVTNSLRTSNGNKLNDPSIVPNRKRIIHGIGANVFNEKVGLISRLGGGVTYSMHYPVSKKVRLALGASALIENVKLDANEIYLGRSPQPDTYYDNLMKGGTNQSEVTVRAGFLVYGKSFYFGGSYLPLVSSILKSSDLVYSEPFYRGTAQAGVSIPVNADLILKPSVMAILQVDNEIIIDYMVKGYIKDRAWAGLTYRDIRACVLSVGFDFSPMISAGYSYEISMGSMRQFNDGSHDLVLALRLNNFKNQKQYTW